MEGQTGGDGEDKRAKGSCQKDDVGGVSDVVGLGPYIVNGFVNVVGPRDKGVCDLKGKV